MRSINGPLLDDGLNLQPRAHSKRGDPDTSRTAVHLALKRAPEACREIYDYLLREGGRTDEEGRRDLDMFSYAKRRCDLSKATPPLVVDSGRRRLSSQGAPMIVWRVKL